MTESPFSLVKSDIEKVVREAETRYETEWRRVFADSPESEECYRVGEEILQKVKDIEWEVQDIADSVATLEANPENFSLGPSELKARKEFIQGVRARLDKVKSSIMFAHGHDTAHSEKGAEEAGDTTRNEGRLITTAGAPTRIGSDNRETNSEKEGHEEARGRLLASQSIEQENEDLDLIQGNVKRLGVMGLEITNKLDEHNTQIEDLSDKVDQTNSNVGGVKAKIARVVGTNRRDRILSAVVCVLVLVLICVVIASVVSKKKKK